MPSLSSCRSVNSAVNLALDLRPARRSPQQSPSALQASLSHCTQKSVRLLLA